MRGSGRRQGEPVELGFGQVGVDEADGDALGRKLCSGDRRELVEGSFRRGVGAGGRVDAE